MVVDRTFRASTPPVTMQATLRGKDFPPTRWFSETPVRERGSLSRGGAPTTRDEDRIWLVAKEKLRGGLEPRQVESTPPWRVRGRERGSGVETRDPWEDDDEIEYFWGHLWFVPKSKPVLSVARVRVEQRRGLVWVRKELWLSKSFEPEDCFPVGEGDSWDGVPSKLNFAEIFWGEEKKRSFAEVVKTMADRGRGRGPRPRNPEEDWERWGRRGGGTSTLSFHHRHRRRPPVSIRHHSSTGTFPIHCLTTHPTINLRCSIARRG